MIEIEFSAIARQCLSRRIPTIERLRVKVLALVKERDAKLIKLNWQFTIPAARCKMNSHHQRVHPDNHNYQET